MSDLDKLIEAVEAGSLAKVSAQHIKQALGSHCQMHFVSAFSGSLDAAKALHEALLPGWGAMIPLKESGGAAVVYEVDSRGNHKVGEHRVCETQSTNPARAWLLAILFARRADSERE